MAEVKLLLSILRVWFLNEVVGIKRLMKVFLTLRFVLRLSNERVTELMSHDAEEI